MQYLQIAHNASSIVPHWSALKDLRVAGDIAGANFENDKRFLRVGIDIPLQEVKGAAIGVPNAPLHSGYGLFVDDNGNEYIVAKEDTPAWAAIWNKGLANKAERFDFKREMGAGSAEVNAAILAGVENFSDGDLTSWVRWEDMRGNLAGVQLKPYVNVPQLIEQIEKTGKKFPFPILILLAGSPVTWQSVGSFLLKYAGSILTPALGALGVPPTITGACLSLVSSAVNGTPIGVNTLLDVASVVVPNNLQQYLQTGKDVFAKIQSGAYADAAITLGVPLGADARKIAYAMQSGNLASLAGISVLGYSVAEVAQAAVQAQNIRKIASNLNTNTLTNFIADSGTAVNQKDVIHYLASCLNSTCMPSAIAGATEVVGSIATLTNDITTPEMRLAMMNLLNGKPVGTELLQGYVLNGLKAQAAELAERGKELVLPAVIPAEMREFMAIEIASDVQVTVFADAARSFNRFSRNSYGELR